MLYLIIIKHKIHKPEGCTFAYGCRLCRLKMGKAEAWHVLILISKSRNACDGVYKLFLYKEKRLSHCDNISVITYITACCSEVDYRLRLGALITVSMNMRHNIMAELLFVSG